MKKIYKSPETLVVQITAKSVVLQMSINSKEIEEEYAGFAKEYNNSSISGKNVWDEEW